LALRTVNRFYLLTYFDGKFLTVVASEVAIIWRYYNMFLTISVFCHFIDITNPFQYFIGVLSWNICDMLNGPSHLNVIKTWLANLQAKKPSRAIAPDKYCLTVLFSPVFICCLQMVKYLFIMCKSTSIFPNTLQQHAPCTKDG